MIGYAVKPPPRVLTTYSEWLSPQGDAVCANCGQPVTAHDFGYLIPRCPDLPRGR